MPAKHSKKSWDMQVYHWVTSPVFFTDFMSVKPACCNLCRMRPVEIHMELLGKEHMSLQSSCVSLRINSAFTNPPSHGHWCTPIYHKGLFLHLSLVTIWSRGFFSSLQCIWGPVIPPKQAEMCTRLTTEDISIVLRSMSDDLKLKKLVGISARNWYLLPLSSLLAKTEPLVDASFIPKLDMHTSYLLTC